MFIEKFKAGNFTKGIDYHYFVPEFINHDWIWNQPELNALLETAAIRLGELNSFSRFVPNIDLFIQLHVTKEAVVSSRIEGTQTNMNEALMPENEIDPERRNDWKEVNNYVQAMNHSISELQTLPLSGRLLRQTHKILLSSVRGEHKMPGEYRTSQNWIGGASLKDAVFIPPHHELLPELMSDLEHFIHNDHLQIPNLIRIALAHYQFETIHPFLDGNGRIGRLLITLFLVDKKILEKPLLYLSAFFEHNKGLYYDNLTRVRTHNNLLQWIKYFLVGVEKTAADAVKKLQEAIHIKEQLEQHIQHNYGRRTTAALSLSRHLLQHPAITIDQAAVAAGITFKPASELIALLVKDGWLSEITGQSRNRIFMFDKYLNAFGND